MTWIPCFIHQRPFQATQIEKATRGFPACVACWSERTRRLHPAQTSLHGGSITNYLKRHQIDDELHEATPTTFGTAEEGEMKSAPEAARQAHREVLQAASPSASGPSSLDDAVPASCADAVLVGLAHHAVGYISEFSDVSAMAGKSGN